MVRAYLPQSATGNLDTNTNNPPQGGVFGGISPVFIDMLFESGETMLYEDNILMSYEGPKAIPPDWFDTDWKTRIELKIKPSQLIGNVADRTDFSMLINFQNNAMIGAEEVDFRFAGTVGSPPPELKYEIESFDDITGTLTAWVKVSEIDNGLVTYVYFNNPTNSAGNQDAPAVWSNSLHAVWHLNQTTFGVNSMLDSLGIAANNFTPNNMVMGVNDIPGKIDGTVLFNGTDEDALGQGSTAIRTLRNDYSIMMWIKPSSINTCRRVFSTPVTGGISFGSAADNRIILSHFQVKAYFGNFGALPTTSYSHVAATMDSSNNARFYLNGGNEQEDLTGGAALDISGGNDYAIGALGNLVGSNYAGELTELRLYSKQISKEQVADIHQNENDFTTFFEIVVIQNI